MTVALSSSTLITQSGTDTSLAVLDTIFSGAAVVARTVAYSVNNIIKPVAATGMLYTCSVAGTTAGAEPAYGAAVGSVTVDGTASFVAFLPPTKETVGFKTVYRLSVLRLAINGSFTWDAKLETLEMTLATVAPVCSVNSGGSLTLNAVTNGIPTYDDGLIIRPATSGVQTEFRVNTGATFVLNGARLNMSGLGSNDYQSIQIYKGSTVTITKGWIKSIKNQTRWGESGSGNMLAMNINGLIAEKIFTTIFGVFGSFNGLAPLNSVTQTVAYGTFPSFVLRDYAPLDAGSFLDDYDIVNLYAINSLGSGLDIRSGQGPGKWITLQKEFTLSTLTAAGAAINGAVAYVKDANNGGRVNIPAIAGQLNDNIYINSTSGAGITPTVLLHVLHAQALSGYQSIPTRDYRTKTTTAGADLFDVSVWAYGYSYALLNDVAMKGTGVLALSRTLLADTGVTLTEASAVAKLASSFTVSGNTLTETAASTLDDLYDALKAYKTRPVQAQLEYPTIATQPVTASGQVLVTAMTVVVNAALTAGAKFNAITVSATLSGTLAAGGAFTFTGGTLTAPVSAPSLTGGTMAIGAANTYAFPTAGSIVSMTPSAPSAYILTGAHTGTLDLRNAAAHAITVQVPAGTTTTTASNVGGAITVTNPAITGTALVTGGVANSRILVRNESTNTVISNAIGAGYNNVYTEGTDFTTGHTYSVTVTNVTKLERVYLGTVSASGFTVSLVQEADTVYVDNALDGSTFTGINFNTASIDLDLDGSTDPVVLWAEAYARYKYQTTLSGGITTLLGAMFAKDRANYLFANTLVINNINVIPVIIGGDGYGKRRDGATMFGTGNIQIDNSIGVLIAETGVSGLTSGESALLADIAPVKAKTDQLTFNGAALDANTKRVNGYLVTGAGTAGSPWGPA